MTTQPDTVGKTVQYDGYDWWTQRTIARGQAPPDWFYALYTDTTTRKTTGWIPAQDSVIWRYLENAIANQPPVPFAATIVFDDGETDMGPHYFDRPFPTHDDAGIYELTGPRINNNPTGATSYQLRVIEKINAPIRTRPNAIPQKWHDLTPQLTDKQILNLPKDRQHLMGTAIRLMYATAQHVHPVMGISTEPRPFHVQIEDGNIHCDAQYCSELGDSQHQHIDDTRLNHAAPVPQELEDIAEILIDTLTDTWNQLTRDERRVVYYRFAGDASDVYLGPEEEEEEE